MKTVEKYRNALASIKITKDHIKFGDLCVSDDINEVLFRLIQAEKKLEKIIEGYESNN